MEKRCKRKHKRVRYHANVILNNSITAKGIDISEGGVYVYTGRSFPIGSIVNIILPLDSNKISARAKVMHDQAGIGMGLKFIDLTDSQKVILKKFILTSTNLSPQGSKQKKTVLIVDDDDSTRRINKSRLMLEGFYVVESRDGVEAIQYLQTETPDLIILDLFMTRMDGFKCLAIIKENKKWQDIPVLVYSARGNQDIIDKVIAAGATEFLMKMITTPVKLAQTVKVILNCREQGTNSTTE